METIKQEVINCAPLAIRVHNKANIKVVPDRFDHLKTNMCCRKPEESDTDDDDVDLNTLAPQQPPVDVKVDAPEQVEELQVEGQVQVEEQLAEGQVQEEEQAVRHRHHYNMRHRRVCRSPRKYSLDGKYWM